MAPIKDNKAPIVTPLADRWRPRHRAAQPKQPSPSSLHGYKIHPLPTAKYTQVYIYPIRDHPLPRLHLDVPILEQDGPHYDCNLPPTTPGAWASGGGPTSPSGTSQPAQIKRMVYGAARSCLMWNLS
jgi:hypothetical protein